MRINHIVNNTPTVVPTKDVASGLMRATGSSPTIATVSGTTRRTGDSSSLSAQQVSRQVDSDGFDAARIEQIRNAIQNGTPKMDVGKIADATLSDAQSLLSTRSKKV